MSYLFYEWSHMEIEEYHQLKSDEMQEFYLAAKIDSNPVDRTKYLLNKMSLSESDYEKMISLNGRPEVLCELELSFLSLNQKTFLI